MSSGSVTVPPAEGAAPLNFVYACQICCYSFADVYAGRNETVKGLSDGINPKERLVTHLFLASCCHVFCDSHLEGGGPAFHPDGQRPKAPCPVCVKERGDIESRDLYSIRGFQKNEYDPMIPATWFKAPPIGFDSNAKEIEALRFQYLALVRYCQNAHTTRKPIQDALAETEDKLASMQDIASREHAKVLTLQEEIEKLSMARKDYEATKAEMERLRGVEQEVEQYRRLNVNPKDLETFKNNKDAIRHYLKLVPMLLEQNEKMKKRLASLGFAMALEPIPNLKGFDLDELNDDGGMNGHHYGDSGASLRKTASSHTAGRSAHTSGDAPTGPSSPFAQRPLKRQRLDSPLPKNRQIDPPTSRDAMPPPQKPVSRMRSVRKMFPSLRKRFAGGRSVHASDEQHGNGDIRMYEDEHWDNTTHAQVVSEDQHSTRRDYRSETPYMSGALPAEYPQASGSRGSQLLSSIGVETNRQFTFRASSPVNMNKRGSSRQPIQIPNEPSYIRLMDGLSCDTGMELGLKDPRENASSVYQAPGSDRQVISYGEDGRRYITLDGRDDWNLGHPFLRQSPHGPSAGPKPYLDSPHVKRTDGYYSRTLDESRLNPVTPAPRKQHLPSHQIEGVVSSSVERDNRNTSQFSKTRIAEPQDSSNHSIAYRSQRSRIIDAQPGRREPLSVNGLSFFESPVISKQLPIQHNYERHQINRRPLSRQYQSRNINSRGYISRPGTGRSLYFCNSAYKSSRDRPTYSNQQHMQPTTAIPFPSFNRSLYARTGPLASTMPSIVSCQSAVRTQPQWKALQRIGVRSSRNEFGSIAGKTFTSPRRHNFSSAGRRIVRQ